MILVFVFSFISFIVKILNLYIILLFTHLYHFFPVSIHYLQCIQCLLHYSDKLKQVQGVINCLYVAAPTCTSEEILNWLIWRRHELEWAHNTTIQLFRSRLYIIVQLQVPPANCIAWLTPEKRQLQAWIKFLKEWATFWQMKSYIRKKLLNKSSNFQNFALHIAVLLNSLFNFMGLGSYKY